MNGQESFRTRHTLRCDVTCVSTFPREKMAMCRLNFVLALDRDFWGPTRGKIRPTEEECAGREADRLQLKSPRVDAYYCHKIIPNFSSFLQAQHSPSLTFCNHDDSLPPRGLRQRRGKLDIIQSRTASDIHRTSKSNSAGSPKPLRSLALPPSNGLTAATMLSPLLALIITLVSRHSTGSSTSTASGRWTT